MLDLGQHRLRFWETPHVHHWDSMMVVEDTTGSLFPSDLFIQPDDQPPVVQEDLGIDMCRWYRSAGLFGGAEPVLRVADRVERLAPSWVHPMHGGSLRGEMLPRYIAALRSHPSPSMVGYLANNFPSRPDADTTCPDLRDGKQSIRRLAFVRHLTAAPPPSRSAMSALRRHGPSALRKSDHLS